MMKVARTEKEFRGLRRVMEGCVGFVPTMGALHEGHLTLVRNAKRLCDNVVVSIFVNPTQFGPNEDFSRYPRPEGEDLALCEREGVDLVFMPSVEEIYPERPQVTLKVGDMANVLCGASRPGHFDGVVQVVSILFNIVEPQMAFFGEKDYQQLLVIRRLVKDLHFPVEIIPVPVVRESDGLAMSSRNRYLTEEERRLAPHIYGSMLAARKFVKEHPEVTASELEAYIAEYLNTHIGMGRIDYVEVRDERDLSRPEEVNEHSRIFIAYFLGKARLIDNMRVYE